jgi:PhnB protein
MAVQLTPYLSFTGNAREAMAFYQEVFGGEVNSNTFADFGESDPAFADQIMHAQLDTPSGMVLMASDVPPGMDHVPGRSVTLILHGDDEQVMRGYWDRLVEEGTVQTALEAQMWGDVYGQCMDRYGVVWMMNISTAQ